MTYKGFLARIEYSDEDRCFIGRIAGIRDVVGFHSDTVAGLREAFEEAVDDYLEACEKIGQKPDKTFSGQFRLRLTPDLHARAAVLAEAQGKSLNAWVSDAIEKSIAA
jgi:predicted HicB family RNase H-like nuclease